MPICQPHMREMINKMEKMIPDLRMFDTSRSSGSESEDEGGEEDSSRLSQKLQETPSLARVKAALPIEEAGQAARILDVAGSVGVFIQGVPQKIGTAADRRRESARIERINIEKEAARKQIQKKTKGLGRRQSSKKTILISDDDEEEEKRCAGTSKRWNVINDEEDIRQAGGSPYPDDENNSVETGPTHSVRENTSSSSSLGSSSPNSAAEPHVQKALNYIRERRKENLKRSLEAKKRRQKMMDEMLLRLLDERGRRSQEEGEKELLRMAAHVIKCKKGCRNQRWGFSVIVCLKIINPLNWALSTQIRIVHTNF